MADQDQNYPPVAPISVGLKGRCPRCGKGHLFDGFLALRRECDHCGLDFSFADSADGPAVFATLIIGFIVVGLALWVEVSINPPLWVHFVIGIPLVFLLCLPSLRLIKGVLIALQFVNKAEQGSLDRS